MALSLVHGPILFHFPACGHCGVILWEARYAAVVSFYGKRGMRLKIGILESLDRIV
jgi:hypothetical protein